MAWAIAAHRWLLTLILGAVFLQFFLAGAGTFGATDFDLNVAVGTAVMPAGLVLLGVAGLARQHVTMTVVLLVLLVLQWMLGTVGGEEPWVGALHGLNALVVGAVAGTLTGRTWRPARGVDGHGGRPAAQRRPAAKLSTRPPARGRVKVPSG